MQINKAIRRYTPPLDFVTDIYVADDIQHCPAINTTDGASFFPDRTKYPTKIVPFVSATAKDGSRKYGIECVREIKWRAFFKGQTLADGADAPELALLTGQGKYFDTGDWKLDEDGHSLLFKRNLTGTWSFYMTGSFVNPLTGAITPVKTPPAILTCAQQPAESFNLTADRPSSEVYDTLIDESLMAEYATGVMQEGLTTADAHNRKVTYSLRINGSTQSIAQDDSTRPWDLLVFQESVNAKGETVSTLLTPFVSGNYKHMPADPLVTYQPNKPEVRYDALFADRAQFRICARDAKDCVTVCVCEANSASPTAPQPKTATAYIKDGKLYASEVEGSTALTCTTVPFNTAIDYSAACVKVGTNVIASASATTVGLTLVAVNLKSGAATAILRASTFNSVADINPACTFLADHADDEDTAICVFSRDAIRSDPGTGPIFRLLAQYYGLYDTGSLNISYPYRGYFALIATPRGGKANLAETQYGWAWKTAMPSFEGKGIIGGADFDKQETTTQGVKVLMDYRGQALTKPTIGLKIDWKLNGVYKASGEKAVLSTAGITSDDVPIGCEINRKGVAKVLCLDDTGSGLLTDQTNAILYTY